MNTNQINYLNIGLMLLSCAAAFVIPFELFLFSYAILGPLHYLTEISWLHKRQYFSPGKRDYWVLAIFALLITFANTFPFFYNLWGTKDNMGNPLYTADVINFITVIQGAIPGLVFSVFAGAALMLMVSDLKRRVAGFLLIIVIAWLFSSNTAAYYAFAVFLPTLVHVFVFTGAFILVGALKGKSTSGILSLVVFVGCAASLFVLFPSTITVPGAFAIKNYDATFFGFSQQLFKVFFNQQADADMIYTSATGIMLARFIAFAYTYHYLNWFSKTSVIKWHMIPRKALITIVVIWMLSLVLYFFDYLTGIMVLYFLSYLHVVFEFPLNFRSFADIGKAVKSGLGLEKAPVS